MPSATGQSVRQAAFGQLVRVEAELGRHGHSFGASRRSELRENVRDMDARRFLGDEELLSNLPVAPASGHQSQNGALSLRQLDLTTDGVLVDSRSREINSRP